MLDTIVAQKRLELREEKACESLAALHRRLDPRPRAPFRAALERDTVNVIAEVKYSSPSRGDFPCRLAPEKVARRYALNGAAALSVLTDRSFFKGSPEHLQEIHRELPELPLLRKDFIIDPYQVAQAAAWGASAYLLIVASLTDPELVQLRSAATDYQLEALVEVHDPWDLERALESRSRLIGVNNRDLKTFQVDLATSFRLARRVEGESGLLLVSESGITERTQIEELRGAGFSAFLIGSHFMESEDPGSPLARLLGREAAAEGAER